VRRRRSWPGSWVAVGLLLVVSLVAGIPYAIASGSARRGEIESVPTTLNLPQGTQLADLQEARVYEIIDGDTIDVVIDGRLSRVRYYGVNTPEAGDRCYREATDRNATLTGNKVLLLADARNTDDGGRLLRYVFRPTGESIDATLVAEGFAEAWRRDGRYRDDIVALQDEAEAADRGCLWR
jgi:micrococcal nuclease